MTCAGHKSHRQARGLCRRPTDARPFVAPRIIDNQRRNVKRFTVARRNPGYPQRRWVMRGTLSFDRTRECDHVDAPGVACLRVPSRGHRCRSWDGRAHLRLSIGNAASDRRSRADRRNQPGPFWTQIQPATQSRLSRHDRMKVRPRSRDLPWASDDPPRDRKGRRPGGSNVASPRPPDDEFFDVLSPLLEEAATAGNEEPPRQGRPNVLSLSKENARLRKLAVGLSNLLGDLPAGEWQDAAQRHRNKA